MMKEFYRNWGVDLVGSFITHLRQRFENILREAKRISSCKTLLDDLQKHRLKASDPVKKEGECFIMIPMRLI